MDATSETDPNEKPVNIRLLKQAFAIDEQGRKIQLKLLWANQTIVFIFLRHFACIACRAHAAQVWADRAKYEKGGAKIVFISNGSAHFIKMFREDLKLQDALILTDPSLDCYLAVGFRKGFLDVVQPASAVNAVKLLAAGHRQTTHTAESGSHWQLGGVLVMGKGDKVVYRFISKSLGDHPAEPEVLELMKTLEAQAPG